MNHIKNLITASLISFTHFSNLSNATEIKTLFVQPAANSSGSDSLTVASGSVAEIVTVQGSSFTSSSARLVVSNAGKVLTFNVSAGGENFSIPNTVNDSLMVISGPATIAVEATSSQGQNFGRCLATIRLSSSDDYLARFTPRSPASSVPMNAIVVPENASGTISVSLESSTDMVNWTTVSPGSFGPATQKRFFRVRALNAP